MEKSLVKRALVRYIQVDRDPLRHVIELGHHIGSTLKYFPKHGAISSCIYSSVPEPMLTSCQVGSYKICESSMEIQNFLSIKCLVVCKMPVILFRFRCVNSLCNQTSCFTSALFICTPVFTILLLLPCIHRPLSRNLGPFSVSCSEQAQTVLGQSQGRLLQ